MARGIPWYMVYYGVLCNTFTILNLIYKAHNVGEKFAESEANVKRTTPKYDTKIPWTMICHGILGRYSFIIP